jgi:hypothetical protein
MLSSLTIGLISAACIFGGALLGLLLQGLLPQHHLAGRDSPCGDGRLVCPVPPVRSQSHLTNKHR